jgi:Flp pilus assembly protein TadG
MVSLLKRLIREDRGTAVLEAAVVFPLLMTLGFGAFEFSNAFFEHQEITTGVRDAARYLAREATTAANPTCGTAIPASQGLAQNLAVYGNIAGSTPARVPTWTTGEVAITVTTQANPIDPNTSEPTYRGPDPLCIITVKATVPYPQLGFMGAIGLTAPTFTVAHFERWIGG